MRKLFTILAAVILTANVFLLHQSNAQVPDKMSYQAVIRNSKDSLVRSTAVRMRISILQTSANGTAVYTETQIAQTNTNGLVTIEIGTGTTLDNFANIDWANGPYFFKTETDPTGGTNYTITGTSQLLSVPYALYAKTSGNNLPGPKGDKGDTGAQGIQGEKGDKGDPGANGDDGLTTSVNGVTQVDGAITLTKSDIGLGNADNTSDANKPISNATQTALNQKVDIVAGKGLSTNDYTTAEQTKLAAITGTNTGDETAATIKSKLGITTLSGSNTGDQDLSGLATKTALSDSTAKVRSEIPDVSGFITSETDPIFNVSIAKGINASDTTKWNNKLSSYNESDPVFSAHLSSHITGVDTANWNHKYDLPSLTSGSLLFCNGNTIEQDNNNLFWNNTNKKLGIGTNSPGVQLEIKNSNSNLANAILKVINNNGDSILTVSGNRTDICLDSATGSFNIYQVSTQKNQLFRIYQSNCFIGYKNGVNIGTGSNNFFAGNEAGSSFVNGNENILIGYKAGKNSGSGNNNIFIGSSSGYNNLSGDNNIFIGYKSGNNNTLGFKNVFIGFQSGERNADGIKNTFIGNESGAYNTSGGNNTFLGYNAGIRNSTGIRNTFIGADCGYYNQTAESNTCIGAYSGENLSTGNYNTFVGVQSGHGGGTPGVTPSYFLTGHYNTALGYQSGYSNVSGSGNLFLGYMAGYSETGSDKLYIDNSNTTSPLIFGDFNSNTLKINGNMGVNYGGVAGYGLIVETPSTQTEIYALYVMGNAYATGIWNSSDIAFKKNISPLHNALNQLLSLNGYTFDWNKDEFPERKFDDRKQIGLIAQEVEKIFPELVKTDNNGYKAIDYSKFTPVLIEAIKEQQKKIESLELLNEKVKKLEEQNKKSENDLALIKEQLKMNSK